mgnify:CR=1 FL=1
MPTLGDIAKALDLPFRGNPETPLSRLASLDSAGEGDLSFVAQKKFSKQLATSLVTAVICPEEWVGNYTGAVLLSAQPYIDFARATRLFDNRPQPSGCVHETAVVATTVQLGTNVTIDAGAVLEDGVVLGDNAWIGPNVWVGYDVKIGDATEIRSGVRLYHGVTVGHGCLIHANTVIGSDGFGFAQDGERFEKIEQIGGLKIGNNVEIGAGCTIDRGAIADTLIGDGVILDNQIHIAHNVKIGENCIIAGQAGFAGRNPDSGTDFTSTQCENLVPDIELTGKQKALFVDDMFTEEFFALQKEKTKSTHENVENIDYFHIDNSMDGIEEEHIRELIETKKYEKLFLDFDTGICEYL